MTDKYSEERARAVFHKFFNLHPKISNPCDINKREKYQFWMEQGFEDLRNCLWWRKQNTKENGYPHDWTRLSFYTVKPPTEEVTK